MSKRALKSRMLMQIIEFIRTATFFCVFFLVYFFIFFFVSLCDHKCVWLIYISQVSQFIAVHWNRALFDSFFSLRTTRHFGGGGTLWQRRRKRDQAKQQTQIVMQLLRTGHSESTESQSYTHTHSSAQHSISFW